ncbi:Stealth CR1 domain-containing protein [Polaribacter sejongensis]|uniref:Stealth CR1 domain-containing protein n=1 Tax=Polaribacter sejongensis TaxID=985043 RepID=UPI0035A6D4F5
MQESENLIIDAVITWVDGKDPIHKAKISNFLENKSSLDSKAVKMRFNQVNEIEFAVKSILKYAKFVRNIYIVTDNQTPGFLKDKEKASKEFPNVIVVDHKVIFEGNEDYLPVFNSISIETLLFKIPSLAEHFIYFNDDFFYKKTRKLQIFLLKENLL